jgi:hypothetical protein
MNESIESILALISRIAVQAPLENPKSTDIPNDALRLCRIALTLTERERAELSHQFSHQFSEFQKRSILARVTTLCESFFNTKKSSYLEAATFFYDLTCKFEDWRECKMNLAIILHSLNSLDPLTREAVVCAALTSCPNFAIDYSKIAEENTEHTSLKYFNIELSSSGNGHRFKPKQNQS